MAAAAWLFRYRPVSDPLEILPDQNVVMSVSFISQELEETERFLSALPEGALAIYDQYRENIGPRTLVTLYAYPGGSGLAWGIDLRSRFKGTRLRWIRRNADGFGFVAQEVNELAGSRGYFPFEFSVKDGVVALSAGRRAVGLPNHLGESIRPSPLRLRGLVPDIYDLYHYRPEDASSPFSLAENSLLNVLPAEIVYKERSATSTSFIVHGLARDAAMQTTYLQSLRSYVGRIEPASIKKVLPDGSFYVEKRDGTDLVQETTKDLNVGRLTYLKGFERKRGAVLFEELGGEYWMAPDLDTVQAGLTMGVTPSTLPESCLPRGGRTGFIFSPTSKTLAQNDIPWILAWMRGFRVVSLIVEDQESGLFTICGKLL